MIKRALLVLSLLLAPAAGQAVPGGQIGFLMPGSFMCEMPGDATGPVGLRVPEADFTIINANSYTTAEGRGIYLLTGDLLQMTSGPHYGAKYHRITNNFLRVIGPDGLDTDLHCVRRVVNNS